MARLFDILGPTMVGPSSSHTAGACRLGLLAKAIVGGTPERARIGLHGSFAMTGEGHGTKRAIVGGLLGFQPDDPRLKDSFARAGEAGLAFDFEAIDLGGGAHPNAARLEVWLGTEETRIVGSSIGGGRVRLDRIDGFDVSVTGVLPTLVVLADDVPGTIALITGMLAESGLNLATMRVDRTGRGEQALMTIEADHEIPETLIAELGGQDWVHWIRRISAWV
jgi:L-serine dehydratase